MNLAVLFGALGNLAAIFIPVFGAYALLGAGGLREGAPLISFVWAIAICAAARGVLRYAEQYFNHFIAFRLLALIRDRVFGALRRLAPAKLEGRDKGNLISLITTDVELIEVFYAHTISPTLIAVLVSAFMCVFLGLIHPAFAAVALLAYVCVGALIPLTAAKKFGAGGREIRDESGNLNSFVLDSLRGVGESIQYGNADERLARIREMTAALADKQGAARRKEGQTVALTGAAVVAFSAIMVAVGVLLFRRNAVDFAGVLISTVAMMSSFGAVIALSNLPGNLSHTFAAANRIFDLMEEVPAVEEVRSERRVSFDGMSCEHVTFSYGAETRADAPTNILSDFSLTVPPKRVIGITGSSGSGKSTLLRLLMRFWDVDAGRILLSGEDVREVDTARLRETQGYMTQDTQLFSGSLLENIRIALPEATLSEVEEACVKASIHEFISGLPEGYDTMLGELGDRLSEGEKQRIGLARVFLHDAPLILLDEPTSNLDSLNEAVILRSLLAYGDEKAIVLVSHRASTMRAADVVCTVK
jgi:ATP-binding cassette subfamily C protein